MALGEQRVLTSPSALRNRDAIGEVLRDVFSSVPATGVILELACGTGDHTEKFASMFAPIRWLPSDIDAAALASVEARRNGGNSWLPAQFLDLTGEDWPDVDAMLAINVIHASPWKATEGLMRGAGRHLSRGGLLVTYGAYRIGGELVPSNQAFDQWLREERDPRWGRARFGSGCGDC